MKKYILIIIVFITSCDNFDEREVALNKKEVYGILHQEKATYPGLGFEKDTIISIVHVYDPIDDVIKEMFITNVDSDPTSLIDSLLKLEIYKNDTVRVFQVECEPLKILKDELTFFLYGGFDGKKVDFYKNGEEIYVEKRTSTYLNYIRVDKSDIDSIGVSVNNTLPVYSIINKELLLSDKTSRYIKIGLQRVLKGYISFFVKTSPSCLKSIENQFCFEIHLVFLYFSQILLQRSLHY